MDEAHSIGEPREIIIGHSSSRRLLLVIFTEPTKERIRVISARSATRREQRDYEEKPPTKAVLEQPDELAADYRFEYAKAKPNRFAQATRPESIAVLLDPDVAQFFETGEAVNAVLRALMTTMPAGRGSSHR